MATVDNLASLKKGLFDKPYPGPRSFNTDEAHLFFGRDREARALTALIVSERLVLFYAQSGAGKSSLLNARVRPNLERDGFEVLPPGRVSGISGREDKVDNIFVFNLIASLDTNQTDLVSSRSLALPHFLDNLIHKKEGFTYDPLYEYQEGDDLKPRVLFIDQFEEIFTTNTSFWHQRDDFFSQLGSALRQDEALWVVLTIREDFVAALDPYLHYLPNQLGNRYYLQRLKREAALAAIREPALVAEKPFAAGAAEMLVNNLLLIQSETDEGDRRYSQFAEPVQLQAVCSQMWSRLSPQKAEITIEDVQKYADVDTALQDFYEDTIREIVAEPEIFEYELREWFARQLITEAGTRSLVYRGDEQTGGLPTTVADLVKERYILREVVRPGGIWYELPHDRFVPLIVEANKAWRLRNPYLIFAEDWDAAGRQDTFLIKDSQLDDMLASDWKSLGSVVALFVAESLKLRKKEKEKQLAIRRKMEEARQRELREIEAVVIRREEARRIKTSRTVRWVVGSLLVVAFLTTFISIWTTFQINRATTAEAAALEQRSRAVAAQSTAEAERIRADVEADLAREAQAEAEAEGDRANFNAEIAVSQSNNAARERENAKAQALNALTQGLISKSNLFLPHFRNPTKDEVALSLLANAQAIQLSEGLDDPFSSRVIGSQARHTMLDLSGKPPYELFRLSNGVVTSFAIKIFEDKVALGEADGVIRLWETGDFAAEPVVLEGHTDWVNTLAFDPAGRWLASGSDDSTIRLWDLADLAADPLILEGHTDWVNGIAFDPSGEWLAAAGQEGTVKMWNLSDLAAAPLVVAQQQSASNAVAFDVRGERLAAADDSGVIQVWEMSDLGAAPQEFSGHEGGVRALAFDPSNRWLASGGVDGTLRLWEVDNPTTAPLILESHEAGVFTVAFDPGGRWLISGGSDQYGRGDTAIRLWDLNELTAPPLILQGHQDLVVAFAFDPAGRWFVSSSWDGTLRRWFLNETLSEPVILSGHEDRVWAVAFDPLNRWLASASYDQTVRLWNLNDLTATPHILTGHEERIRTVAFDPTGRWLASGSYDHTVRLWDLSDLTADPMILRGHDDRVIIIAFDAEGGLLASGSYDGTIRLWNMSDLTAEPLIIRGHQERVLALAFDPRGRWLASAGGDQFGRGDTAVRLWNLSDLAAEPLIMADHETVINYLAFDPRGEWLAAGGNDSSIRLWELRKPEVSPIKLTGHDAPVGGVAYDPEGTFLVSGSVDGTVRLWNMNNLGDEPEILMGHSDGVRSVAFNHDGSRLASGSFDQTVRLWRTLDELAILACEQAGRNFTWDEWQRFLPGLSYEKTCDQYAVHCSVPVSEWPAKYTAEQDACFGSEK